MGAWQSETNLGRQWSADWPALRFYFQAAIRRRHRNRRSPWKSKALRSQRRVFEIKTAQCDQDPMASVDFDSFEHHAADINALVQLMPYEDHTHCAVRSGAWSDPNTWEAAKVPGAGAKGRYLVWNYRRLQWRRQGNARLGSQRRTARMDVWR